MNIENYLQRYKEIGKPNGNQTTINSERAELVKKFLDKINAGRGKRRPLTPAYISMKLSDCGLKTNSDIYSFYNDCSKAKCFGAYFFWAINKKNICVK